MMVEYIIKSSASLLVLFLSYQLLFRNDKRFHFNRAYLLTTLIFSLVLPFLDLSSFFNNDYMDDSHALIKNGADFIINVEKINTEAKFFHPDKTTSSWSFLINLIYGFGTFIMSFRFLKNLNGIRKHIKTGERTSYNNFDVLLIEEKLNPFCFGRFIFVNKEQFKEGIIDEDILLHETAHAKLLHTFDILFIELLLIFYWFNPLVWRYRQLLKSNHEFCADDFVIRHKSDSATYCHKILNFLNLKNRSLLISEFNYSLTKNRILMMTKTKTTTFWFGSKLFVAALMITCMATGFSFIKSPSITPVSSREKFIVVVDAGHGGKDTGSSAISNVSEKDIVLNITQLLAKEQINPSIHLLFTRSADKSVALQDRVAFADKSSADLFLSLHINHSENEQMRGMEIYYSEENKQKDLAKNYSGIFAGQIKINPGSTPSINIGNFTVLKDPACPSVMLNLGYISNKNDLEFITDQKNQKAISRQIVKAITTISELN